MNDEQKSYDLRTEAQDMYRRVSSEQEKEPTLMGTLMLQALRRFLTPQEIESLQE